MRHTSIDQNIAKGLRELRKRIRKSKVPSSMLDEQILLASWNIREFGKGTRSKKALHLIAEILSYFDLIAIQEVRGNLRHLKEVQTILGPYWRVVFSDVTRGRRGNQERIAYLYDKRAVAFTGLAAEAVIPPKKNKPSPQFWRTPYIASFRAGTFDFVLLSVHILWGSDTKDRLEELKRLAQWVKDYRDAKHTVDRDIIVMGDFNIPKRGDKFYKAITRHGLKAPVALFKLPRGSNLPGTKVYDQILHYRVESGSAFSNKGGVVDFYRGDHRALFPGLSKTKFTYQLSDHLPLWIQLNTDTDDEQLDQILNPPKKRPKKKRRKPKAK